MFAKIDIGNSASDSEKGQKTLEKQKVLNEAQPFHEDELGSVCLKEPVSDAFQRNAISHLENGRAGVSFPTTKALFKFEPENVLFQPKWAGIEPEQIGGAIKQALKALKDEKNNWHGVWGGVLGRGPSMVGCDMAVFIFLFI